MKRKQKEWILLAVLLCLTTLIGLLIVVLPDNKEEDNSQSSGDMSSSDERSSFAEESSEHESSGEESSEDGSFEEESSDEESVPVGGTATVEDWNLILVNSTHYLPEDFTVELKNYNSGHKVDARIVDALRAMMEDCKAAGLSPLICSSYRDLETQTKLYERRIQRFIDEHGYSREKAIEEAGKRVAIPGTSEHHTGLAVDIVASSYQVLDTKQEETAEQKWLMANCHKYGFILRYPNGTTDITGIIYEPWHYRYVGVEHATRIMQDGLTLEEYLEQQN